MRLGYNIVYVSLFRKLQLDLENVSTAFQSFSQLGCFPATLPMNFFPPISSPLLPPLLSLFPPVPLPLPFTQQLTVLYL